MIIINVSEMVSTLIIDARNDCGIGQNSIKDLHLVELDVYDNYPVVHMFSDYQLYF